MTVPVLIVSHGELAQRLLDSARAISGQDRDTCPVPVYALCVDWCADAAEAADLIEARVRRLEEQHEAGVLILTEMFGDTPSNCALRASGVANAAVVTGVNLPMVLSLCCEAPDLDLPDLADWIWSNGRKSIQLAASGCSQESK